MTAVQTRLAIDGTRILINGQRTYEGSGVEGRLFNVRTVNATFDDTLGKVSWWDDDGSHPENDNAGYGKWTSPASAGANTRRFIEALPEYKAHGVLAVDLCFQGGHPIGGKPEIEEGHGSAGSRPNGHRDFYHNSGFQADGSIDEGCAERMASVIDACDKLGMAVILQLFYFGQDPVFPGEAEVIAATDSAVDFVCARGWGNVIVEIANEVMAGHYHHEILKPARAAELIVRARERAEREHGAALLVSTSEAALLGRKQWTEDQIDAVFSVSDVVLLHGGDGIDHGEVGDRTEVAKKIDLIQSRPWYRQKPRPIVFNESDGELAFEAAVAKGASFGLHSTPCFQTMFPPKWGVWENETKWFFDKVKAVTGA